MATRTINLKMVIPRGEEHRRLRQDIWATHEEVNRATAAVEERLLLCRGEAYRRIDAKGEEVEVAEIEVKRKALELARDARKANSAKGHTCNEQMLEDLRSLYETFVPSCVLDEKGKPLDGDAQQCGALVSPLMDPESEGGLSVFQKVLNPPPDWVPEMAEEKPGWERRSEIWLESDEAKRLMSMPGSPPAWVRRLRSKNPWQEAFVKDQEKKRLEVEKGNAPLIKRLKESGLLPLVAPPVRSRLKSASGAVTKWDRLVVRLAVAHLLSWESWNHRTRAEHNRVKERLEEARREAMPMTPLIQQVREYEKARHAELVRISEAMDDRPYRLGKRAIRNFDRLRDRWLKEGKSASDRLRICAEMQTSERGRFGDPEFYRWLAADGREGIWRELRVLPALVSLNVLEALLERRKETALYTAPDARRHPRWAMYEAPDGTNLKKYEVENHEGRLRLSLPVLCRSAEGLEEKVYSIPLAPSGQIKDLRVRTEGKKQTFSFTSSHQRFAGRPGGADLLFDRLFLENRDPRHIRAGHVGPVWLKLTLDIEPDQAPPPDWLRNGKPLAPPEVWHFQSSLVDKSTRESVIAPGFRILSVDLGLRSFAACSVFELVKGRPAKGLCFSVDPQRDLYAQHERSFMLRLPGEKALDRFIAARGEARDEIRSLNGDVRRLRDILRLSIREDADERRNLLQALRESLERDAEANQEPLLPPEKVSELESAVDTSSENWEQACTQVHSLLEKAVSRRLSEWRRRTRPRPQDWQEWRENRSYAGGKSLWMVRHLDDVRRLLLRWSLRGRQYGQINRQDRESRGVFASRLLRHINNLKEDRVKTGADLLVQAARGFVPDDARGWRQTHQPCRAILFEDLARYRFQTDRPRSENSQLMKWNHREIRTETEMQAAIYGITVTETAAGFSSRFHAATGAPGCRCRILHENEFEGDQPKPHLVRQLHWLGKEGLTELRPGTLVPWPGGDTFVTIGDHGRKPLRLDPDINAAQNLQRRFWGRCGEAFRLPCRKVEADGLTWWYPQSLGKRQRGAMMALLDPKSKGYCRLAQAPPGWQAEAIPAAAWRKAVGATAAEEEETGEDEIDEALAGLDAVASDERETFFRDPSGIYFPADRWFEGGRFWSQVRSRIMATLGQSGLTTVSTRVLDSGEEGDDEDDFEF